MATLIIIKNSNFHNKHVQYLTLINNPLGNNPFMNGNGL